MSRFLSNRFENLEAYTPGEQPQDMQYIKLNTNESPYPPSPEVVASIQKEQIEQLRLYPDPEGKRLRQKLANLYGVSIENIFLSNGSDDILNFAFMAFCDETHGAIFPEISYGFYTVYADLYHVPAKQIPLRDDFSIDHTSYCHAGNMVVIANPNAPTGMSLSLQQIEEIIQSNKNNVVVIDEAYIDFGGTSCVELIKTYDNLIVVQTFSKSRSMAGARLGFAIASESLIADLNKIKYSTNPYNINRLTLIAGEAAIDSNEYYMENCKKIIDTRTWTIQELQKLGFSVLDSVANFIFATTPQMEGESLYIALKQRGVLVRHFKKEKIKNYIRITIGTQQEMKTFIETIAEIIQQEANA